MDKRVRLLVSKGKAKMESPATPIQFKGPPAARRLVNDLDRHPHAFVLACILDRQVRADRAWNAPLELSQRLGGFSFSRLKPLSLRAWRKAMTKPTALHRMPEQMAVNLHAAVDRIGTEYRGDAAKIWDGSPPSAEVVYRFLAFQGIGPKIATMATNILARHFKVRLADYYSVDISADVHVRRVFARLGLTDEGASVDSIVYRARALYPEFPGIMDLPVWEIGTNWCHARAPRCGQCYMKRVCAFAIGQPAV